MDMPDNDAFASNSFLTRADIEASMEVSLDDCWIGALSRLGRIVMTAHRLSAKAAIADFQSQALAALDAELGFAAACWATGTLDAGPVLHDACCLRLSPESFIDWQARAANDALLAETIRQRGSTLRATIDWPEQAGPDGRDPRQAQMLATTLVDPVLGVIDCFRFFRRDTDARFDEPERLLVQHALPHFAEAWRHLRIRQRRLDKLSPREAEVARRFGQGLSYQEIARELHLSPATVRNHLANIYGKVGVNNKVELARLFD